MNDRDSRENRIHGSEIKPFGYYACEIPNHFHCVPMHWHREFELNFVREGSASFICGEEKFHSAAGDIIIIQPNVMHSIYPRESMHQVYDTLVFRYEIFGGFDSDRAIAACIKPLITGKMHIPTHITTDHPYYAELEMMMNNIFSCAKGDTPQLDLLMRSELLRLFWLLETEATVEHDFYELGEAIRPALEYIAEHFQEPITVKQLADSVHLSESYFMHQFQKQVGFRAVEYLSHYRINQACKELLSTKKACWRLHLIVDFGIFPISIDNSGKLQAMLRRNIGKNLQRNRFSGDCKNIFTKK